jgi:hypothetical protein
LRLALVQTIGDGVVPVPAPPTRLRLLPARRLTLRLPAGTLTVSDSRVRPEPPAADRARSLPGRGHGSFIISMATTSGSNHATWVSFGKQSRVNSRERRSSYVTENKTLPNFPSWTSPWGRKKCRLTGVSHQTLEGTAICSACKIHFSVPDCAPEIVLRSCIRPLKRSVLVLLRRSGGCTLHLRQRPGTSLLDPENLPAREASNIGLKEP